MNIIMIIGITAGSITIIGFFISIYRRIRKTIKNISERMDNIEMSLHTKQRFSISKGTKVNIVNSNQIITLSHDDILIVDKIEKDMVYGKIFFNSIDISVSFIYLGDEIN